MRYFEFNFSPVSENMLREILTAELLEKGFDSFQEDENELVAYLPDVLFHDSLLTEIIFLQAHPEIRVKIEKLEEQNWNAEWEKNYPPVTIAGKCHVRAPFHPPMPGIQYEIVIEPKMAFGTAHHETTQIMVEWLMNMDVMGKDVLDMGCGTGILAILANKMGAGSVTGIDNDEWAWQNARENFRNNSIPESFAQMGDAGLIGTERYDIILANINRNILIKDMLNYARGLRSGGELLISGFYQSDTEDLKTTASQPGLEFSGMKSKNEWAIMLFRKHLA